LLDSKLTLSEQLQGRLQKWNAQVNFSLFPALIQTSKKLSNLYSIHSSESSTQLNSKQLFGALYLRDVWYPSFKWSSNLNIKMEGRDRDEQLPSHISLQYLGSMQINQKKNASTSKRKLTVNSNTMNNNLLENPEELSSFLKSWLTPN
jgi:hypothetical protein